MRIVKFYWIHDNKRIRMFDAPLDVYHFNGSLYLVTFSKNVFLEIKNDLLIGAGGDVARGRITIAYNLYNIVVNGRAHGEFRNVDAHVFNNSHSNYSINAVSSDKRITPFKQNDKYNHNI